MLPTWSKGCVVLCLSSTVLLSACGRSAVRTQADAPLALEQSQPMYALALQHMRESRYEQAQRILTELVQQAPSLAGPRVNLAIIHAHNDDLEQAEAQLQAAIKLKPEAPIAHNELGMVYRRMGRFLSAEQAYAKALAQAPEYAKAHYNLAVLYDIYLRRSEEALAHYQQYQSLAVEEDAQVGKWVADLQRRIKKEQRTAQVTEQ